VTFEQVQAMQQRSIDRIHFTQHRFATARAQGRVRTQVEQGIARRQLAVPDMPGALDQVMVALAAAQGAVDKYLLATP